MDNVQNCDSYINIRGTIVSNLRILLTLILYLIKLLILIKKSHEDHIIANIVVCVHIF
jgi:hypothetical protein